MRTLLLMSGVLLGNTLVATAQTLPTTPAAAAGSGVQRVRRSAAEINPELEAAETADRLTGQLSLGPEQTARVKAAAFSWVQARRDLLVKHNAQRDHSTLQAEGNAIEAQYESQLTAILTPAQAARRAVIQARFRRIREQADANEKAGIPPATRP